MADRTFPFVPKSIADLLPGQFWAIRLSDGRFACGRVLRISKPLKGLPNMFVAGLLDWVGAAPPTGTTIAGASLVEYGQASIQMIQEAGDGVLGYRDLEADGIIAPKGEEIKLIWGPTFATARAERRFVEGNPAPRWWLRDVRSPLTEEMLSPFPAPRGSVQFKSMLTDADFMRLAEWFQSHPDIALRAYGSYDGSISNLEFLRFFPTVRRFSADALYHSLQTIEGLRHLPENLESLTIGWTKPKLDLAILARFKSLKALSLEGQTKEIAAISRLTSLEELTLRSITLPDLSLLLPLTELRALDIKLGGTKDLSLLPRIGRLQYLELWMVKGLTNLTPVGQLPHLRYLFLQSLRRVEALPDFSHDVDLRRVHLEMLKGLRDLRPLATAPALEQLVLMEMRQLEPEDLRFLLELPHLKGATVHLGSKRKTDAVEALLNLPNATSLKGGWREV